MYSWGKYLFSPIERWIVSQTFFPQKIWLWTKRKKFLWKIFSQKNPPFCSCHIKTLYHSGQQPVSNKRSMAHVTALRDSDAVPRQIQFYLFFKKMIKVVFQFTQYIKILHKLVCKTSVKYKCSPGDLRVWSRLCYSLFRQTWWVSLYELLKKKTILSYSPLISPCKN